jgi:putative transposase
MLNRRAYPSDLSDPEWAVLEPLMPAERLRGRPRERSLREVVNAILYLLRTGCAWDYLPHDFPPSDTVYGYFRQWEGDGTWERIHSALRRQVREADGRRETPSAAIVDSQSVKSTERGGSPARLGTMQARR